MSEFQEIISLVKQYLENSVAPNGFWDNVVEYILPVFSMLTVIIGGFWTFFTYIKGKNREINEKILGEVYAPMYQFFVKNDAMTDLAGGNVDYKEVPLLEWKKEHTQERISDGKYEISRKAVTVLNLSRKDFVEMMDSVNLGLAPQELITLFNIYKSVNFAADETGDGAKKARADDYRTSVEYAIRKHAYSGYMMYCKKIGLGVIEGNELFEVNRDCIKLKLDDLSKYENSQERG